MLLRACNPARINRGFVNSSTICIYIVSSFFQSHRRELMRCGINRTHKTISLIRHASGPDMYVRFLSRVGCASVYVGEFTHTYDRISQVTVNYIHVAIDRSIDRPAEPQRSKAHTAISLALKEGNNRGLRANVYTLLRKAGNQSGWKIRYYGAIVGE